MNSSDNPWIVWSRWTKPWLSQRPQDKTELSRCFLAGELSMVLIHLQSFKRLLIFIRAEGPESTALFLSSQSVEHIVCKINSGCMISSTSPKWVLCGSRISVLCQKREPVAHSNGAVCLSWAKLYFGNTFKTLAWMSLLLRMLLILVSINHQNYF